MPNEEQLNAIPQSEFKELVKKRKSELVTALLKIRKLTEATDDIFDEENGCDGLTVGDGIWRIIRLLDELGVPKRRRPNDCDEQNGET